MPVFCYIFPPVCLCVRLFIFWLSVSLFSYHFICLIICPPNYTCDTSEGQCKATHAQSVCPHFACSSVWFPNISACLSNCLAWARHQAGQHNMLSHVSLTWRTPCATPARGAWHTIQCFQGCQSTRKRTLQSAQALRRVITYTRGEVAERCLPARTFNYLPGNQWSVRFRFLDTIL